MRPRDELNFTAIHEAGHVAACINLGLEFGEVYLKPPPNYPGMVSSLVRVAGIDYSSGVLTPEEESLSTNLLIIALAGPACEALNIGRTAFDIMDYDDLDEVLDSVEYRFSNNTVRMTFTRYCEAEAFALFEDDRRLWRFVQLLAKELIRQSKLSYTQCMELYSKEYLAESWVRKEVEEIRRADETDVQKIEDRVERQEQRAAGIEGRPGKQGGAKGHKDKQRGEQKHPVQDRESPKHEEAIETALEAPSQPVEAGGPQQGEHRGRRRRRGRGRGRGKRRETLEQLPGEVIGGQPAAEAPKEDQRPDRNVRREQQHPKEATAQKEEALRAGTQEVSRQAAPQQDMPVQAGEAPKEERVKKQVIKAVKPPVPEEVPMPAGESKPAGAVLPPVAEQRPAEPPKATGQRPLETPPVVAQEEKPAAAGQPRRRPAVSGGPKAEGEAVSGGKGTTHPDSIWETEKKQGAGARPKASSPVTEQQKAPVQQVQEGQAPGAAVKAARKKPAGEAKPRTTKAARVQAPVAETAGGQKKTVAPVSEMPAGQKKAPSEPKSAKAQPAKAAKPATKKAAKEPPKVKSGAKPAKSEPAEPKPETPRKRGGGRKKAAE